MLIYQMIINGGDRKSPFWNRFTVLMSSVKTTTGDGAGGFK